MSLVTCHICIFFLNKNKNPLEKIGQNDGAIRWRVCYQQGLPLLVHSTDSHFIQQSVYPYRGHSTTLPGHQLQSWPCGPVHRHPSDGIGSWELVET